jgi:hypothetical protein
MGDEYKKESINKRLAKQYAAEALEKEREIREYNPSTKKFTKGINELSRYDKMKLVSVFSTARDYFDKAGDLNLYSKFNTIVETYGQPVKEELKSSLRGNPSRIERKVRLTPKQQRALDESNRENELQRRLLNEAEKGTWSFMTIATLLASLFFVSSSLTGFAVSNLATEDMQWAGLCFFACGLVFALLFLRKKYSAEK